MQNYKEKYLKYKNKYLNLKNIQIGGSVCNICDKVATNLCSRCKKVYYCTKEHQVKDWPNHKKICEKKLNESIIHACMNSDNKEIIKLVNNKNINENFKVKVIDLKEKYTYYDENSASDIINITSFGIYLANLKNDKINEDILNFFISNGIEKKMYRFSYNDYYFIIINNIFLTQFNIEYLINFLNLNEFKIEPFIKNLFKHKNYIFMTRKIDELITILEIFLLKIQINDIMIDSYSLLFYFIKYIMNYPNYYPDHYKIIKLLLKYNCKLVPNTDNEVNRKYNKYLTNDLFGHISLKINYDSDFITIFNEYIRLNKDYNESLINYKENELILLKEFIHAQYYENANKYSWNIITEIGIFEICKIFDIEEILQKDEGSNLVLEVGGGNGFISACFNSICKKINMICTDSGYEEWPKEYYPVIKQNALDAVTYIHSKVLFVSRPRDFITNPAKKFIDNGGLIIIMIGETRGGNCAPTNFYDLIKKNKWTTVNLKECHLVWHHIDFHDQFEIHYSPTLKSLTKYYKENSLSLVNSLIILE